MSEPSSRALLVRSGMSLHHEASRALLALLALGALVATTGCATRGAAGRHAALRGGALPPECARSEGGLGPCGQGDDFQRLQQSAGLEEDSWLEAEEVLDTSDARELWQTLARTRTTLQSFGPRRCLSQLLGQVLARGESVPYGELVLRLRPFRPLVVMRPDGYLAGALSGKPLQRMGHVELREGRLMAGNFEVGAFYLDKGGVFYSVDDSLRPSGGLLGELGLEHDPLNAALDGAQDALGEMSLALAQFVTSPVRSVQGLRQLPSAVAALIASSPQYFAHYSALPLQEQIREAARISTHLLMLYGSAAGTATRLGTVGTRLSVLSLSAEGTLAVEQVTVPTGYLVQTLGTGASATYVLMGSSSRSGESAPGHPSDRLKGVTFSDKRAGHIFRDAPGHLKDTPSNRQLLKDVANDPSASLGTDNFGNHWSARMNPDGTQTWVQIRNGELINGGVNPTPRMFHPETGLSAPPPGG